MGNEIVNYLDNIEKNQKNIEKNQRELATVQIGNFQTEKTKVIVKKVEETFFLVFEEPEIISLLEGQSEFEVKINQFELSKNNFALCTCFGGNHIEIKWM